MTTTEETCFKCGRPAVEDGVCAWRWDALSAHRDIRRAIDLIVGASERISDPEIANRLYAATLIINHCDADLVETP
jgi:hypothetical protein